MREQFHARLDALNTVLGGMCAVAADQLRVATRALLTADVVSARRVAAADRELDLTRDGCERDAQALLVLQAPVASDLRLVLAVVYCADRVERMGDLARHVAESVCRAHPHPVVPESLAAYFREVGSLGVAMAEDLHAMIIGGGVAYDWIRDTDSRIDRLHRGLMARVTGPDWAHGVPAAVEVALLARYYERFGDQVVSAARRMDFARTGELPH